MITLKTLTRVTDQEVFDQVATHLLKQCKKSEAMIGDKMICMYRSPNGLKCAAGCLIADDEYDPDMEGTTWDGVRGAPKQHQWLIMDLQRIHDKFNPDYWGIELHALAARRKLNDATVMAALNREQ